MNCLFCGFEESKVVDKRDLDGSIRRRRECLKCARRYTTHEHSDMKIFLIIKKDGRKEPFSREKLLMGIQSACNKRPVEVAKITKAAEQIEQWLYKQGKKEIKSKQLGSLVLRKLKLLDEVAYLRFTSVHKEFEGIDAFKEELAKLEVRK